MTNWKNPGRSTVSSFIIVDRAQEVIEFAQKVFAATLLSPPLCYADGAIWNAEIDIGGSTLMLADAAKPCRSRRAFFMSMSRTLTRPSNGCSPPGAKEMMPLDDQFYGDRAGGVVDSQGNTWWIATHRRDMTDAEIEAAARIEEKERPKT